MWAGMALTHAAYVFQPCSNNSAILAVISTFRKCQHLVALLSLGCSWTDLLSPKPLLGAGGKGDVEKGGEEDPSTARSSAVALGGWEKEVFFLWGKILGRQGESLLLPLQFMGWEQRR